ncbi:type I-E CRISPR-associated endoribonuclease Cas2 [Xylanimonas oleitrophica]|uniref:Type I-E CRISPR-associated endoribonuclease Cas2 n=1 Tax=Xylanimonas oleitrophica TaxID=2607479 RepID=A0A2W5WJL4_9MICO|nr:type I-E CRISPR-associated endoribonuclease Cas2e [Xylanimonas oleitrophica]PZR51719.1 type I-E CRISPR-associated endoribonuclease Cas2 [Xylanimonas oleitrophica]
MIVVVLSVTPEKLRGELTRWLLEISAGVYVGHLPARVREMLWLRVVEDVGRGRALMVWSTRGEQRLAFRVHNHAWAVEDFDGLALVRRQTAESRELARRRSQPARAGDATGAGLDEEQRRRGGAWSLAGRRRRYRNAVERRRDSGPPSEETPSPE